MNLVSFMFLQILFDLRLGMVHGNQFVRGNDGTRFVMDALAEQNLAGIDYHEGNNVENPDP